MNARSLTARSIKAALCALFVACALSLLGSAPQTAWAAGDVAKVGSQGYATVQEAVSAAGNGDTIQVVADSTESVTIPEGKRVILSFASGVTLTNEAGQHTIINNGSLTITGDGAIDNVSHARGALYNDAGATATLNGCTYTRSQENGNNAENNGGNSWYNIKNFGAMTINAGVTVKQSGAYSSLVANGWQDYSSAVKGSSEPRPTAEAKLTINGGVFSGGLNTIKNDDFGILQINDGDFVNVSQYALMNWNVATINGGTFETQGANGEAAVWCGHDNDAYDKGVLNIAGGSFSADNADCIEAGVGAQVSVSGGDYTDVSALQFVDADSDLVALAKANGTFVIMMADEAKAQKATSVVSTANGDIYFLSADSAEEFAKDNTVVNDVKSITYTVTFIYGADPATQSKQVEVNAGEAVDPIALPTFEGYTFAGWFSDENRSVAYDMDAPIWEDTTLYADWEKAKAPTSPATPENDNTTDEIDDKFTDTGAKSETPKTSDGLGIAALALGCIVLASGAVVVTACRKMTR